MTPIVLLLQFINSNPIFEISKGSDQNGQGGPGGAFWREKPKHEVAGTLFGKSLETERKRA